MTISVLVVVKNAAGTLRQTLDSILAQHYQPLELVVVDGASTDGTPALLEDYRGHISRLVVEPDSGPTEGVNKAIKLASGDVIGFLFAGDWYEPSALLTVSEELADCDVLCGSMRHWENSMPIYIGEPNVGRLSTEMSVGFQASFFRRTLVDRVGLFDETFDIATDYDFLLRCRQAGGRFCATDTVLANMTLDGRSAKHWIRGYWHAARSKMHHIGKPVTALAYLGIQVLRTTARRQLMRLNLGGLVALFRQTLSPCSKKGPGCPNIKPL